MGADRRGPLAAFIVVAIIAAILLVTSVRSQAAPSLLTSPLRDDVVVVPAPPTSQLWSSVSRHAGRVVHQGVVLAHKARQVPAVGAATLTPVTTGAPASPIRAAHPAPAGHHQARHHRRGTHASTPDPGATWVTLVPGPAHPHRQAPIPDGHDRPARGSAAAHVDHTRHLGWAHQGAAPGWGHRQDHRP